MFTYCAPISVGSFSSMVVNVASSGVSERDDDAIFARRLRGSICMNMKRRNLVVGAQMMYRNGWQG
jgi:hypothetical protein